MTELATTFNPDPATGTDASPEPIVGNAAPALITEQQVLFGSAAAVALPAKTRRFGGLFESVRSAFARPEKRPARKHYPKRHAFLEGALMSREMDRL